MEEGRRIHDNVRRSLLFLLPTNGAQSLVILVAMLFGLAMPLKPVQVLWVNMVTSVTLASSLANERAEHDIMTRPPRQAQESIVTVSTHLLAWRGGARMPRPSACRRPGLSRSHGQAAIA